MDPDQLYFTQNWTNSIKNGSQSSQFNQKQIEIHQKLTSSFNQNLIFIIGFESDRFCSSKLKSELESDITSLVEYNLEDVHKLDN